MIKMDNYLRINISGPNSQYLTHRPGTSVEIIFSTFFLQKHVERSIDFV